MILVWLIVIPFAAGAVAWAAEGVLGGPRGALAARWVALLALLADLGLALSLWTASPRGDTRWLASVAHDWVPSLGVRFQLAADGLSLVLVLLTLSLGALAVATSWRGITRRVGLFHANLLWVLGGVLGVFLALDLVLFYVFWELMLVPMAVLIALWGHAGRVRAAIKFFIFTQASGLLMLLAILGLAFAHRAETGTLTFSYEALLGTPLAPTTALLLMLGFFVAFAVKLPVVPLHTWLPDAHAEAPAAGSLILAGLLLKTGAYGLLRFALPLFPEASRDFAPVALVLGAVGILYGAFQACGQRDLKRLVAYTSVSHLGFVLLGVYAFDPLAHRGVVLQLVAHGLSTGGLFVVAGALHERLHTRDLEQMGGLWPALPRLGGLTLVLAMASLGLPGLGNFVAEVLILIGAFRAAPVTTAVAAVGLVLATVYALAVLQRVFHGPPRAPAPVAAGTGAAGAAPAPALRDVSAREAAVLGLLVAALVWLGLYPQPLLDAAAPALAALLGGP